MAVAVATPITHAVVCSEDKCGSIVRVESLNKVRHLLYSLIDYLKIVQTKQMEEEDDLVLSESSIKRFVGRSFSE
ncbi:hypothetical protein Trco_004220 [Trichoderma cornu-damae]|uniref:Uncharacterized protein n=1 Tax=Trichoderma cornu-damae TaxID=654480 RepID=A0A9P8QSP2_9HYPO|nr:hypothetical protein Trco_004220 [Trichoderma cornu-damae]